MSGRHQAPAALPRNKSLQYSLDKRLGGPQIRCGHDDEKKILSPQQVIELQFSGRPARRLVTALTELLVSLHMKRKLSHIIRATITHSV
jgi:hypothetical protein